MDVSEVRKQILYGDDACPSHLQSQSSVEDLGGVTGVDGQRSGKLDKIKQIANMGSPLKATLSHLRPLLCI